MVVFAGAVLLPALLLMRLPSALDGRDSVNFALGLGEFDPGLDQPHFPGYPVYIVLCRGLAAAGLEEPLALALPGVLLSPLLVLALWKIGAVLRLSSGWRGLATAWLALHPLLLACGARPAPDLLGATLIWCALALATGGRGLASGALIGIGLGVRLDLAPFAGVALLLAPRGRALFCGGLALGLLAWLPSFLVISPPDAPMLAVRFAGGHFSVWGSSLLAGVEGRDGISSSLLLAATGVGGFALALLGALRAPPALRAFLLAGVAPYAAWVAVGQNLGHARHLLALAPAAALLGVYGLASLTRPAPRVLAAVALLTFALPAYRAALRPIRDGRALVAQAVELCGGCEALYVGDSKRLFDRYAPPGFQVYRRSRLEGIRLDDAAWSGFRAPILATSEVAGAERVGQPAGVLEPGLVLYRIEPGALR